MAAPTVTYSLQTPKDFSVLSGGFDADIYDMDLASLSNGGLVAVGYHGSGGHVDINTFTQRPFGNVGDGFYGGVNAAVTQIANGNIVTVTESAGDILYTIAGASGLTVTDSTSLARTTSANADVAAMAGGGFAVVLDKFFSGSDYDINLMFRNADGSALTELVVDVTSANDQKPSVSVLDDGGVVVAWQRDTGGATSMCYKVFNANGSARTGVIVADSLGSINRDVQTVALDDGGFAVVYEDNGRDGSSAIGWVKYDAQGAFVDSAWVTDPDGFGYFDEPSVTLLSNGMVGITYTYRSDSNADQQVMLQVIDHNTGDTLLDGGRLLKFNDYDEVNSSVAGFGMAGIAVAWDGAGGAEGGYTKLVRTTTCAGGADIATGDESNDIMKGMGGADQLNGGLGNDQLIGHSGNDKLTGSKGNDRLIGGTGGDTLTGGKGRDTFSFNAVNESGASAYDHIKDLENRDKIDLKSIDANILAGGDQAFTLVGSFSGAAGQAVLTFHTVGDLAGDTTLELDVTGDGFADFALIIEGDHDDFNHFIL